MAVLGILLMNAVSFRWDEGLAPLFNLNAVPQQTWLDWAVGIFGKIFIDQKFMGLFSMLFGAGMILFIDRASRRGRNAVRLNIWRNSLLLMIGSLHSLLWVGDVLMLYAGSSFVLITLRKQPSWIPHLRWAYRVRPSRGLHSCHAIRCRHDQRLTHRILDSWRDFK